MFSDGANEGHDALKNLKVAPLNGDATDKYVA